MALTRSTYAQAESAKQYQDVTTSPATISDGTLRQRFDVLAFPPRNVKFAGPIGSPVVAPVLTLGAFTNVGCSLASATSFCVHTPA